MTTEFRLDICTPEGKTWLARITGLDPKYGLAREFTRPIERKTSRSGMTGTAYYALEDGLYESQEGRRKLGKHYWRIEGGEATQLSREELLEALQ